MPNYYNAGVSTKITKTAAQFASQNRVLPSGAVGFETDTKREKTGDGVTRWNDLEYASSGGAVQAPDYSFDGTTGIWTVDPGQNPGSARFASGLGSFSTGSPTTTGDGMKLSLIPFTVVTANSEVATQVDEFHWRFAAAGLYLISANGPIFPVESPVTGIEEHLQIDLYPDGISSTYFSIPEWTMNNYGSINFAVSAAVLATNTVSFDGRIELRSRTHPWQAQATITIVRLD